MHRWTVCVLALLTGLLCAAVAWADPGTTWDTQIPDGATRFPRLADFDNAAVLDRETGRVWEQAPGPSRLTWVAALRYCYTLEVGGRKGWRLPTIEELASLVDTSQTTPALPVLPPGHPFQNVQTNFYWSATSGANATIAWRVNFGSEDDPGGVSTNGKGNLSFVWCVRGGQGIHAVP